MENNNFLIMEKNKNLWNKVNKIEKAKCQMKSI